MCDQDVLYDDQFGRFHRYVADSSVWSHMSEVKVRNWVDEEVSAADRHGYSTRNYS